MLNECLKVLDKECYFITNITFVYKYDDNIITKNFEGKIKGQFTYPERGNNGFGYDPIFTPYKYTKTFAEMSLEEKIKISHRTIALKKFKKFLKTITILWKLLDISFLITRIQLCWICDPIIILGEIVSNNIVI